MLSVSASRIGLLACAIGLVLWTAMAANHSPVLSAVLHLRFSGISASGLGKVLIAGMISLLPLMLLGAFANASLRNGARSGDSYSRDTADGATQRRARRALAILARALTAWGLATLLALACIAIGGRLRPDANEIAMPGLFALAWFMLGTLAGSMFGAALRLPAPAALRSVALRVLLGSLVVGGFMLFLRGMLLETQPSELPRAQISTAAKRDLVELARIHNPLRLGSQTTLLHLPPQQLNMLLAWAVSIVNPTSRARISADNGAVRAEVSVPAPVTWGGGDRYINASLALQGVLTGKTYLRIAQCSLRVGRLSLGDAMCGFIVRASYDLLTRQASADSALNSLHRLSIGAQGLSASYSGVRLNASGRSAMRNLLGPSPTVQAAIVAQFALLRALHISHGDSDAAFAHTLRAAFALAAERTAVSDAVSENQAAILALAAVVGHHDVATVGGFAHPSDFVALREKYIGLTLRGRDDWRKHFMVSAALTQMSSTLLSDAAGLLKEELDAEGPSGFSFADLQMDRAGTVFAAAATFDAARAQSMQHWMRTQYDVDCIAPSADDMPEDITDADLEQLFGGVGGPAYRTLVNEIERRVRRCTAYRR